MKKPEWRKYKGGWKRGVLEAEPYGDGSWLVIVVGVWVAVRDTPEAAMQAADAWWEKTRKRMEGK